VSHDLEQTPLGTTSERVAAQPSSSASPGRSERPDAGVVDARCSSAAGAVRGSVRYACSRAGASVVVSRLTPRDRHTSPNQSYGTPPDRSPPKCLLRAMGVAVENPRIPLRDSALGLPRMRASPAVSGWRSLRTSSDRLRARCPGSRFDQAKRKPAPRRPGRPVFVRGECLTRELGDACFRARKEERAGGAGDDRRRARVAWNALAGA
jgi:hypothetical protein